MPEREQHARRIELGSFSAAEIFLFNQVTVDTPGRLPIGRLLQQREIADARPPLPHADVLVDKGRVGTEVLYNPKRQCSELLALLRVLGPMLGDALQHRRSSTAAKPGLVKIIGEFRVTTRKRDRTVVS